MGIFALALTDRRFSLRSRASDRAKSHKLHGAIAGPGTWSAKGNPLIRGSRRNADCTIVNARDPSSVGDGFGGKVHQQFQYKPPWLSARPFTTAVPFPALPCRDDVGRFPGADNGGKSQLSMAS